MTVRLPTLAIVLAILTGSISAQAMRGRYPLGEQDEAGCWIAVDFGDGIKAPNTSRTLRVTALVCLAMLADGSTIRSCPHKRHLKDGVRWLRKQQDKHGRYGFHTEPDWILDHAMASYAMAEACLTAPFHVLRKDTSAALDALTNHLSQVPRSTAEVLLWSQLTVNASREFDEIEFGHTDASEAKNVARATDRLASEIRRLLPNCRPDSRRKRLAHIWLRYLRDPRQSEKSLALDVQRALENLEVFAVERPLESLYLFNLAYQIGGRIFKQCSRIVGKAIARCETAGQGFDPSGEFAQTSGRIGATAVHMLTLTIYYRYTALVPSPATKPKK